MGFGDRWTRAQAAARDQIAKLTASDRGSVVLFGSGADIQLRSTAERSRLQASVDSATPSPSSTRFSPALKVAGSILAESTLPKREVVIISDFQRGGWRGEEGAKLPAGTTLTPVPVQGAADKPNLSVTGVTFARSSFSDQQRLVVTAGITNRTEQPVKGSSITLEVGGLTIGTKPVAVEGGSSTSVVFDAVHGERTQHARERQARRRRARGRQHVQLRRLSDRAGSYHGRRPRQRRVRALSHARAVDWRCAEVRSRGSPGRRDL